MSRPLHLPTPRQGAVLAVIGALALAAGFYLRHQVIEQAAVGIACTGGSEDWLCTVRRGTIALFTPSAFGFAAMIAALLNLMRPSLVLWAIALLAAGFGIVLYNVALSALAVALLILSLARPAAEAE
jgi:hypothetical protein